MKESEIFYEHLLSYLDTTVPIKDQSNTRLKRSLFKRSIATVRLHIFILLIV